MDEIDNVLTRQIQKDKTPSVQYVIFNKEKIIHRFQAGFADIKKEKISHEHTSYNAYSVTKTFTALAVMQLAEQKKLEIDHPVKEYLPEFPYPDEITIRQLLTHSAGIPNPVPLGWIHLAAENKSFDRNSFFRQVFLKNNKTKSKPNEKYAYSNLGYVLLGQLIEKVSGLRYEDAIRERILKPLNIDHGELDFIITDSDQHAKGYHKKFSFSNAILGIFINKTRYMEKSDRKWNSFKDNYVNGASYGGLIGTSDSFVKYLQELLKPDCKLLTDNYKKMLFTENFTMDKRATGMCLSWFTGQLNHELYFSHAGGGGGYYCEIRIYPKPGIGSVIMFNRTGMKDERFLDQIDKYFINEIRR